MEQGQPVLDVLRVAVILYPSLLGLIDESPKDGRPHTVRRDRCPGKLVKHPSTAWAGGTHPITETSCKEGTESGPSPAVDPENESELQPVPLGDEDQIILGPKGYQNSREIGYREIVFRPLYVHHQTSLR
jgi:hypothetical protein